MKIEFILNVLLFEWVFDREGEPHRKESFGSLSMVFEYQIANVTVNSCLNRFYI